LAVALHDTADLPAGTVALSGGFITANVDSVDLVFHGRGGHGAKPHEAIDPVVMAAEAVLQFQTIVSRRIRPERPAVITVGKFSAGTKHNIIPPTAELLLTVRSYDDETRATLLREIQHVANEVAEAYHAPKPPTFVHDAGSTPSGFNDQEWSRRLRERFSELLGDDQVVDNPPTMVGEDFALFSRQLGVPGVMWRLGAVNPSVYERAKPGDLPGLHSDLWAPDAEHTLPVGARTVVAALIEVLEVR
jgi:hippurate hydrolase